MGKKSKKAKRNGLIAGAIAWDKALHKRMRKRFGLSKYQYLSVTFVKGLAVGFTLALLFQAFVGSASTGPRRQPCRRSSTALFLLRATTSSTWMATPYFPREAMKAEFFRDSRLTTVCGWKGTARYWDVVVGDEVITNVVWAYDTPKPHAEKILERFAFYRNKGVTLV